MFTNSVVYYGSIVQVLVPFVDERTCLAADARFIKRWAKLGRLTQKHLQHAAASTCVAVHLIDPHSRDGKGHIHVYRESYVRWLENVLKDKEHEQRS